MTERCKHCRVYVVIIIIIIIGNCSINITVITNEPSVARCRALSVPLLGVEPNLFTADQVSLTFQ